MIFVNLSSKQKNAINHVQGPALILAVPGAGKTTVLVHRTHNLIKNHGVQPDRILSITFSRASALDMKARFTRLFPHKNYNQVHFSTIHSFCYGFIKEYAYISKTPYKLIEGSSGPVNKYNLLKQIYISVNKEYPNEEKLENLINAIGYIKNMLIDLDDFLKDKKINIDGFRDIFRQYETYKKKNNLLDFDDILLVSLEVLKNNPYLLAKYRSKYDFIQLDEGQDTSRVQMEIIKLIAHPNYNLFIVADDDQSIYGFRGAYPQGLLNFSKDYKNAKIFFMEENYRSSQEIVNTCNEFIRANKERYEKNIFTNNQYKKPITIIKERSINFQYDYIIKDLRNRDLSKTSILFRNNLSAIGLINLLEKNKIPFKIRDRKLKFFSHWLLREILDFMSFAQDPSNMEIYERIFYKMKGFISRKQISYAKNLDSSLSVFDRILDFPGINRFYQNNLKQLKLDFKKLSKLSPGLAIDFIEYDLEYGEYLKDASIKLGHTYDNLNTMLYFLKTIGSEVNDLEGFTQRLNRIRNLCLDSDDSKDSLTLSTVHSAKGLEFENVYMIDLIDGEFPTATSIEEASRGKCGLLEEERRLFYVGMSRAKSNLQLLTYKRINNKSTEVSSFLKELDKSL